MICGHEPCGVIEEAVDTSASDAGRQLAIRATRDRGKIALAGEGGFCNFAPGADIIHGQKAIYGSWVTSGKVAE